MRPSLCALLACTTVAAGCPQPEGARAPNGQNVLVLLTEDQGAHLGLLGTPGARTPNMDALAESGVYFRRAFVVYPVCSASKASFYTGLHAHSHGLMGNTTNFMKPAAELTERERTQRLYLRNRIDARYPTLIERLRDAGYYTGVSGKLHVAPNERFPYDELIRRGAEGVVAGFVARAAKTGRPWFLLYGVGSTHRPFRNSDEEPIGVDPAEVDLPDFLPDTPVTRRDWAEYLDAVGRADRKVGEALDALRASGQEERTLVIWTSDHGPSFQRGKMSLYDLGLRVPLVVRGPRIASGVQSDALVSQLDLMPTILDLLGIDPPALQHGRSLRPILEGEPGADGHDFVFAEISDDGPLPNEGMQERTVHDGRFRLIYRERVDRRRQVNADLREWTKWRNRTYAETVSQRERFPLAYALLQQVDPAPLGGRPLRLELYDTWSDPDELRNLAEDPGHAGDLRRLFAALERWARDTGDDSIAPRLAE
jgi:N-sulfoglucosamine sulfohydrolase